MNFLVDDQLPVALARWIALQGHVAIHVLDVSLSGKDDLIIWRFASNAGCIVVTKDQDFQARRNREPGRLAALGQYSQGVTPRPLPIGLAGHH
jgi:predicted nuclease of predicted toxin-antitoxin system